MPDISRELLRRLLPAAAVLFCAAFVSGAEDEVAEGDEELACARARIQALAAGHGNALPAFQPAIGPGEDPRPGLTRNVPMVRVSTPWKTEEILWIQVPEHAWTHLPGKPAKRLLFAGDDVRKLKGRSQTSPFPQTAAPSWTVRTDGGIELRSALSGGISVAYLVLPSDRAFEIRFGVTNSSEHPLLETESQFCVILRAFDSLNQQSPETSRMLADGKLIGWGDAGQDLSWIDAMRDPASGLVARPCFFLSLVSGSKDPRFPPKEYQSRSLMWLRRTVDAPILVKSSPDGRRHLVLYSPCGRSLMYNALGPCCHIDPYMDGVKPGETRWVVLYGLFFEGELGELMTGLVELDGTLRRTEGFLGE